MQQLHLVAQTVLAGLVLVMLVVIYAQGGTGDEQPSIFLNSSPAEAAPARILPRPMEQLGMIRLPVAFPLMRNVGM